MSLYATNIEAFAFSGPMLFSNTLLRLSESGRLARQAVDAEPTATLAAKAPAFRL